MSAVDLGSFALARAEGDYDVALFGDAEARIDDKFRLQIPSRWRAQFGDVAYVGPGDEPCVRAYTEETVLPMQAEVDALSRLTPEGRQARRAFYPKTKDVPVDRQGRFVLPVALRRGWRPGQTLLLMALGDWIELWHPAEWEEFQRTTEHASQISPTGD